MCKNCDLKPVYITLNHQKLCKKCFFTYFERKVLKNIRTANLIKKDDVVVCGISGGKDSTVCLYLLHNYLRTWGNQARALLIDEGIEGYRHKTLVDAEKFCKERGIPLKVVSLRKEFGKDLDDFLRSLKKKPCTPCGIFRRYLLNKHARQMGATALATGHNLDDEAQSLLMNQMKGNMKLSAKLGPKTGVVVHKKFVRRIKPLYFMTEKEVTIYALLKKFPITYIECPYFHDTFREHVGTMLNNIELKYPGTKQGIINSFLEVLPKLREDYKNVEIKLCKTCKEPATRTYCKACELLGRSA